MKKIYRVIMLGLALITLLWVPAMAMAATGIRVDGKTYTFLGDQSIYEADGKTFIIGEKEVRIQEPGKADRVLPLESTTDDIIVENFSGAYETQFDDGTVVEEADEAAVYSAETQIAHSSVEAVEGDGDGQYKNYDRYAQFGLSYDSSEDALYYQNRRVRMFTDSYPLGDNGYCDIDHFDPNGTIDVEARRDLTQIQRNADGSYDPGGLLEGLRALSDAEFASRDLSQWTDPQSMVHAEASDGHPMTPEEKKALYAPYAEFGLEYNAKTDRLSYQGQTVRRFLDVKRSNGEPFSGGNFRGTMTQINNSYGEVDITVLRDYSKPDADGNGKLIGLEVENTK